MFTRQGAFPPGVSQMRSYASPSGGSRGFADTGVEIVKVWEGLVDFVAVAVVVGNRPLRVAGADEYPSSRSGSNARGLGRDELPQQLNLAPCLEPDIPSVVMLREFNSPAKNTLGLSITAIVELHCWVEGLLALTPLHYARLSQPHHAQEAGHAEEGA